MILHIVQVTVNWDIVEYATFQEIIRNDIFARFKFSVSLKSVFVIGCH